MRLDLCKCPLHIDGLHCGERVRKALGTRSLKVAERKLAELRNRLHVNLAESTLVPTGTSAPSRERTVADAVSRYLSSHGSVDPGSGYHGDVEYGTFRKYRCSLAHLSAFCEREGPILLSDLTLDRLEDYRRSRHIGPVTWKVELQSLRTFLSYCVSHNWLTSNPAKELKPPRNLKPNEVVPYTLQEESRILAACDQIGGGKYHRSGARYEQLRARAMLLLLRHTALRISDVATLRKDAISWDEERQVWRILVRTQKNGEPVYLPIPKELKIILDAIPLPRNAAQDCPYYFWNGATLRRAVVGIAERTLFAVFKKSAVKNAHAHRYRHTLATRLLANGAEFQTVADILGNTAEIVRKHYGKWSKGRQENIDRLMMAHFESGAATNAVTKMSHEKMGAVN
jgi:integrase